MKPELMETADGSHTLFVRELNEHYHSTFGAISESLHIFIGSGLSEALNRFSEIRVLEVGFGTGLNALLTWMEAERTGRRIFYTTLEPFPLDEEIWPVLNYPESFCTFSYRAIFNRLHEADWNCTEHIPPFFSIRKIRSGLEEFQPGKEEFNLVYFDTFGPDVQPGLWREEIFAKLFAALEPGGILVTYSAKGAVRRAMKSCGFRVEKLPGPAGKREITRANKP